MRRCGGSRRCGSGLRRSRIYSCRGTWSSICSGCRARISCRHRCRGEFFIQLLGSRLHLAPETRELREELGLEPAGAKPLSALEGRPRLIPFLVAFEGEPRTDLAWGWFTAQEMLRLPIPPRNSTLVARLGEVDLIG